MMTREGQLTRPWGVSGRKMTKPPFPSKTSPSTSSSALSLLLAYPSHTSPPARVPTPTEPTSTTPSGPLPPNSPSHRAITLRWSSTPSPVGTTDYNCGLMGTEYSKKTDCLCGQGPRIRSSGFTGGRRGIMMVAGTGTRLMGMCTGSRSVMRVLMRLRRAVGWEGRRWTVKLVGT